MACKALGTEHIINNTVLHLGDPERTFLIDGYAQGKDGGLIDLVLVGKIDKVNLDDLGQKTECYIGRKFRVLVVTETKYCSDNKRLRGRLILSLWKR